MRSKLRLGLGMVLLALLMLGGAACVVDNYASAVITLPNGGQYRFAGMDYGTNHVRGPLGPRSVNNLTAPAAASLTMDQGKIPSTQTPLPSLCIWFDPVNAGSAPTNGQNFDFWARLANEKGVMGGTSYWGTATPGQPFQVLFWVVPRRDAALNLVIFSNSPSRPANEPVSEICRVRLPNLLHGRFPQWRPDTTFPAVKAAGDVEVHLDNFMTGDPIPNTTFFTNGTHASAYGPAPPGELAESAFNVSFKSLGQDKGPWMINQAELSDATGNHFYEETQYLYPYQYQNPFRGTLWPDEGAWRLKLELKHPAPRVMSQAGHQKLAQEDLGFRPEELLTFSNVPLLDARATNELWFTNAVGNTRIAMREYVQEPPGGGSGFTTFGLPKFHAECADGSEGIAVDFVEAISPRGEWLETGSKLVMAIGQPSSRAGDYVFTALLHPDTNASTVNVTWLVQKTRSAEFLFKPPSP